MPPSGSTGAGGSRSRCSGCGALIADGCSRQLPQTERDGVVALLGELERMNLPAPPRQIAAAADALAANR